MARTRTILLSHTPSGCSTHVNKYIALAGTGGALPGSPPVKNTNKSSVLRNSTIIFKNNTYMDYFDYRNRLATRKKGKGREKRVNGRREGKWDEWRERLGEREGGNMKDSCIIMCHLNCLTHRISVRTLKRHMLLPLFCTDIAQWLLSASCNQSSSIMYCQQ